MVARAACVSAPHHTTIKQASGADRLLGIVGGVVNVQQPPPLVLTDEEGAFTAALVAPAPAAAALAVREVPKDSGGLS
jgi:hypothetical protein